MTKYVDNYVWRKVKSASTSSRCNHSTENDMSGSRNKEEEKGSHVSSNNGFVPCLQHVTIQDQYIGLIVDWPIQIVQSQLGNRPQPLKYRAESAHSKLKVATDKRTVGDKADVLQTIWRMLWTNRARYSGTSWLPSSMDSKKCTQKQLLRSNLPMPPNTGWRSQYQHAG